ncbi:POT-type proton-dependent oligopeptide transporter [Polyangium jinanense]|uniref:Oligopeptide:H+ symporter n=1 Tax=Polyangium jinanense TaxID=2829994 RepID=A0A9X4AUV1_9BACT|nr:oligopeptide:H+ symporter [Polyangium jinanense]MDC3958169.1 oligopeptide:H+ symporter [Polyangium jinanense]MDC3983632.1 oligopeptide:H+ symporter [Polyangium jinanense]
MTTEVEDGPAIPKAAPAQAAARYPKSIPSIIGNEACERFSFYGMRNILTDFLIGYLLLGLVEKDRAGAAKEVFHVFVMGVYFFPLLGGWISDRFLGKYRTIFWLSLLYCVGHGCLAVFEANKTGFYAGLFLIALGSGGIKPCVSSFVGDQFDQTNKHLARGVFEAFYWVINFGSFFASQLMPRALKHWGPSIAFGIPGILMFIATLIFWMGRKTYVVVPPSPADPHSFGSIAWTALQKGRGAGRVLAGLGLLGFVGSFFLIPTLGFVASFCLAIVAFLVFAGPGVLLSLEAARGVHPDEDVEGVRSVLKVLVVFALVTPFWSLFDQKASTWIIQGKAMVLPGWSILETASQMQAINPLLVMLLIPFNNAVTYPLLRKIGLDPTPLRRMTAGIAIAGVSWIVIGVIQRWIDAGEQVSILWQLLPYTILTLGEVLVSTTGLEFAYSQAPAKMKGTLMSFWSLSVTVGGLWVLIVNAGMKNERLTSAITAQTGLSTTAFQMFFFAGFAFLFALAFGAYATRYKSVEHYRKA